MAARRDLVTSEPTIALFEPLRLVRAACARWPELDGVALLRLLPEGAADDADLDRQVPLRSVFELLAQIARRVQTPNVPLLLAESTRVDEMGVVGFAIMTARSGREALARTMRFQRLISAAGSWQMTESEGQSRLLWQRALPLDLGHRLANEIVFAQLVGYARALLGPFAPHALYLRHRAPCAQPPHEVFFGCPVHFAAQRDELVMPASVLDRAPVSANDALAEYFNALVEQRVSSGESASLLARVRALVAERLLDGEPEPETIARRLGMSLRTLQTRLRDEGTTLRALIEALRRERAQQLLERGESVTSTAFALGFSETSAFSRAFRRWHGHSPRALRAGSSSSRRASSS
jgi:AraC-like DNA-binding protein